MLTFTIPGRPTAWQRTNDVNGRKVTPKDMREAQARIRGFAGQAAAAAGLALPLTVPLKLEVLCIYEIPAGFRGAKLAAALEGRVYRPRVPDFDNLVKQISDALNPQPLKKRRLAPHLIPNRTGIRLERTGGIYSDDALICHAVVVKRYGDPPRTVVRLSPLPDWADHPAGALL